MTQKFVRYSPDVEREEPFEKTLQTVLDEMKQRRQVVWSARFQSAIRND